jgi:hypothetical protein
MRFDAVIAAAAWSGLKKVGELAPWIAAKLPVEVGSLEVGMKYATHLHMLTSRDNNRPHAVGLIDRAIEFLVAQPEFFAIQDLSEDRLRVRFHIAGFERTEGRFVLLALKAFSVKRAPIEPILISTGVQAGAADYEEIVRRKHLIRVIE